MRRRRRWRGEREGEIEGEGEGEGDGEGGTERAVALSSQRDRATISRWAWSIFLILYDSAFLQEYTIALADKHESPDVALPRAVPPTWSAFSSRKLQIICRTLLIPRTKCRTIIKHITDNLDIVCHSVVANMRYIKIS
jgi:hypothetical protein